MRDGALVGYFSILTDAIKLQGKERPHGVTYGSGPAIKLGRMGVDNRYSSPEQPDNNCGGFILRWVIGLARDLSRQLGIRYITLDAIPAPKLVAWYEDNGFVRNEGVKTSDKIVRKIQRGIGMDVELPHVSMRYDILLAEEVPPAE